MGISNAWLISGTNRSAGFYVTDENPNRYLNTDPTDSDSDDDGILDGVEDADHNGAIDGDLDRDYVWDFDETWFETSPRDDDSDGDGLFDGDNGSLQQGEYAEDTDNDGIVDSDETDPIKFDSDGDGIGDGEELIPGEDGYVCDPTKLDTDGDGLTDGQEIKGWSVAIYKEATGEMIGDPWDVTSDPNDQDTDNDLLGDYEEFQHSSDPNNTDTDGDSIGDYAESCSSKNSITGFDGIAPSLTIDINTVKKSFGRYHMRITIWSSDMAGIDKVRICVRGIKSKTWQMYGESSGEKTLSFQKDWGRDLGDGYKILAQTWDVNGNFGEAKKEVPGITKRIVDFVMEIVEVIKEAVKALVNLFIDWIWKAIQAMMDVVLKPIKDMINNYVRGVGDALVKSAADGNSDRVGKALFGSFYNILKGISNIFKAVFNIVEPFLDSVSGLLKDAQNFMTDRISGAFLSGKKGGDDSVKNKASKDLNRDYGGIYDLAIILTGLGTAEIVAQYIAALRAIFVSVVYLAGVNIGAAVILTLLGVLLYHFGQTYAKNDESKIAIALSSIGLMVCGLVMAAYFVFTNPNPLNIIIGGVISALNIAGIYFVREYILELNAKEEEKEKKS